MTLDLLSQVDERRSQLGMKGDFEFGPEVLEILEEMFHGKCAFCEAKRSIHFHRFRPPAEAEPFDKTVFAHLYYVWLRTDWNNVFAACEDCAVSAGRRFPVRGLRGDLPPRQELEHFANENYVVWRWPHRDRPLLLDPCATKSFSAHLAFDLNGGIQPQSRSGAETIATYRLDRGDLVQSRARAFGDYLHLLSSPPDVRRDAFEFETLEHGGAWLLLLQRLTGIVAQTLDISVSKDRNRLPSTWDRILDTDVGKAALESSLSEISKPISKPAKAANRPARGTEKLAALRLVNFKALEAIELTIPKSIVGDPENGIDNEASALLVLGENAAGKSSILEAVALSLCGAAVRQKLGRATSSFVLKPELMGQPDAKAPPLARVELEFQGGRPFALSIGNQFEESDSRDLPPVFAYGAFRQFAAAARSTRGLGKVGTLFRSDIILPNPEQWLLGLEPNQFAMVARALQHLFTVEGEFNVIVPDRANSRCMVVTRVGSGDEVQEMFTPLSVVSSGFRSVLAMVCDIFEGLLKEKVVQDRGFAAAEAVILIDEIEAHLHPRWKMQIMTAFRRVFQSATILATTHDPLCLRGMHDREVLVLSRVRRETVEDGQVPVVVETLYELPNVENLTIEQLLTSDFFAMFSTDSPDAERKLADLGNLLAKHAAGEHLSTEEQSVIGQLEREVIEALPLGTSEVQRLVQGAVAEYLQKRRSVSACSWSGCKRKRGSASSMLSRVFECEPSIEARNLLHQR